MGDMAMPQRTPEHDRLNFLVGEWKTREVHAPSPWLPQGGTGEGRSTTRWGVGNMSLITDYKSKGAMGPSFEGHGVLTYDPAKKTYVGWWFDSMNPVGMATPGHFEGTDLIQHGECDSPEGKMKFRMVTHPVSADEHTFTIYGDQGGKWAEMMTITYVKA
jgi:hypothetical protein